MMIPTNPLSIVISIACGVVILRIILSTRALLFLLGRSWRWLDDRFQVYQFYKIPRHNECFQENPLHRKASVYISSLPSVEDSDNANLFSSGRKSNDFFVQLDAHQTVHDSFLGAKLSWTNEPGANCFLLRLRKQDRRRVLRPYLHHVETVADEIEQRKREVKLFTNSPTTSAAESDSGSGSRWRPVPFTHPSTLDTVAMDPDLKNRIRADLESFLKGKAYYHRLGRVWKRSYLLYGPPGTGKSSFVAAMAKFLCYDVYDMDLSRLADGADLKAMLLQTSGRSVIVMEDLDRYLSGKSGGVGEDAMRLSGILNFMDGIFSCCGEERVMVFTMNGKEGIDPAVLRPGRLDVHIYFPMCDFSAFKTLASSYLGLKDHKLYPQVEESFQIGARLSPAEIGEIMIANRGSPSRALKSVINALQQSSNPSNVSGGRIGVGRRLSESGSVNGHGADESGSEGGGGGGLGFGKDGTLREFRKLYGLIRMRSGSKREAVVPMEMVASAGTTTGEKDR